MHVRIRNIVQQAIQAGQIGTPVAARWFFATSADRHASADADSSNNAKPGHSPNDSPANIEPGEAIDRAASALAVIASWLDDVPASLFARSTRIPGGDRSKEVDVESDPGRIDSISVHARFARGGTALVSFAAIDRSDRTYNGDSDDADCRRSQSRITLFGNQGILNWEDDGASSSVATSLERHPPDADVDRETLRTWTDLIRRSLAANDVVSANGPSTSPPLGNADIAPSIRADGTRRRESANASSPDRETIHKTDIAVPKLAPPYGVALVAGDHTHQPGYADAFLADGRSRLIAVTDEPDVDARRAMLNRRLAARLGVPYEPDCFELFRRSDVQIVCCCVEPYRRGRVLAAAVAAGKHLYLDKPLAGSLDDARRIAASAAEHGLATHMFSQIHWPPAADARRAVESGRLGRIVAMHCDLCFAKGHIGTADLSIVRREAIEPVRFELPDAKRELTNIGVYCLVAIQWMLGQAARRVYAVTGNYFFAEHQRHDMEDFGQMTIELADGATATVTSGRTGWQSHPSQGLNRIALVGTRGTAVFDAQRPRLECWSASSAWSPPNRDPEDPLAMWAPAADSPFRAAPKTAWQTDTPIAWVDDVRHFLDRLETGRPSEVPASLAAAATSSLFAAYRSAATGTVANVEPVNA